MQEQVRPMSGLKVVGITLAIAGGLGCLAMVGLCVLAVVLAPPPSPGGLSPPTPRAGAAPAPSLPTYRVASNKVDEDMIKAQAEVRVVVTGNVTRAGLEALLRQLHDEAKARTDLRHHDHVGYTLIGAFAPHQRIGEEIPLANLNSVADMSPTIQFNEPMLR